MLTDLKLKITSLQKKNNILLIKEYLKNDTLPDSTNITPHISIICSQNI